MTETFGLGEPRSDELIFIQAHASAAAV